MNKNFYEMFGVNQNATQEEIKKMYKEWIKKFHPDKFQTQEEQERATKIIQNINNIYSILSNVEERKKYDDSLKESYYEDEINLKQKSGNYNNSFDNKNSNFFESFFFKIMSRLGGIIISLLIILAINFGLDIYQTNFAYSKEKNILKNLKIDIDTLEKYIFSKSKEISEKYPLEKYKTSLQNFEKELKILESEYNLTRNDYSKKRILKEYNIKFFSYEESLNQYNRDVALYNKEYKELDLKVKEYEQKIEEYNQIAKTIKHYRIVPRGVRIR